MGSVQGNGAFIPEEEETPVAQQLPSQRKLPIVSNMLHPEQRERTVVDRDAGNREERTQDRGQPVEFVVLDEGVAVVRETVSDLLGDPQE